MAVKIRLARTGRHADPSYRIVAADSRYARDGRYVEQIGFYNPQKPAIEATIDEAIALKWLGLGAQVSDTVRSLFKSKGIIAKFIASKQGK
jgi:small subunit ribosomal protein S16